MNKKFGETISTARKNKNMTQADLAQIMGVTDKAVSKWERDLSYPDIESISLLTDTLEISTEELLNSESFKSKKENKKINEINKLVSLVLKAVALAMGVATIMLPIVDKQTNPNTLINLIGIGLTCIALVLISNHQE